MPAHDLPGRMTAEEPGESRVRTLDMPIPKPVFERVVNPLFERLLRSPLHGLVSDSLLLVTFTGRQSGREFTTPVGYEQRGDSLYVTTQTDRTWWKNLRGGASVTVRLRGETRHGETEVLEADEAIAEYVAGYIDRHGLDSVRRLAIAVDGDEVPSEAELAAGLGETVVVRIDLAPNG